MNDLSLFILDIVQNSLNADAQNIIIIINEDKNNNLLTIEIHDDGFGISEEKLLKVTDPFYTTRTTRKVGLGLSLLKEVSELANGSLVIKSTENVGTTVVIKMEYYHIDRLPLGDINETIYSLLFNNQKTDIQYIHIVNKNQFTFDTKEIKTILNGVSIYNYEVMQWIKNYISVNLQMIYEEGL